MECDDSIMINQIFKTFIKLKNSIKIVFTRLF